MPELPEVEIVVRGLRKAVKGKTIGKVRLNAPVSSIVVSDSLKPKKLDKQLEGRTIEKINRRGKNILISLSGELTLWVHLKMTGKFRWVDKSTQVEKHDLMVAEILSNGKTGKTTQVAQMQLRFNDYRRFGRLRLFKNDELWEQKGLVELGPEPLEISADNFSKLIRGHSRMIKPALMDQSLIAGIGNIYADEALWASRIHPLRLTNSISNKKAIELHGHIQRLLRYSIKNMGTTIDSYKGVNGKTGNFQKYLLVYGREGELCDRCESKIVREKIASRSAHYCSRCQRQTRPGLPLRTNYQR